MEEKKWETGERITRLTVELANVCIAAYEETIKTDPELLPYLFKASSIGVQIAEASTLKDAEKVAKLIFEFAQSIFKAYHEERMRKLFEERFKDSPSSSDTPDKAQGGGR